MTAVGKTYPYGMVISWFVVLIAVIGLLVYILAANPKAAEAGRLMFACGLLATCLLMAGRTVRLL